MANINQIITLGLGTPGDVPHFLRLGLSPAEVSASARLGLVGTYVVLAALVGSAMTDTRVIGTADVARALVATVGEA